MGLHKTLRGFIFKDNEKTKVSKRPAEFWYSEEDIECLISDVKPWNILQIVGEQNKPPSKEWALVVMEEGIHGGPKPAWKIGRFKTDQNGLVLDCSDTLEEAIVGHKVQINNKRVSCPNILRGDDHDTDAISNIKLHVIACLVSNKSFTTLLDSLENEIQELNPDEKNAQNIKSAVENLTKEVLKLLMKRDWEDKAGKNKFKIGKWCHKKDIKKLASEFSMGDRMQYKRLFYSHWAICFGHLGNTLMILHFSTDGNGSLFSTKHISCHGSSAKDKPSRRIDSFSKPIIKFLGVRVNNRQDNESSINWTGRDDFLDKLLRKLTPWSNYSLLRNNCKHRVDDVRYDSEPSAKSKGVS